MIYFFLCGAVYTLENCPFSLRKHKKKGNLHDYNMFTFRYCRIDAEILQALLCFGFLMHKELHHVSQSQEIPLKTTLSKKVVKTLPQANNGLKQLPD